ncbi:MAG: M20/M25/M40 family metallo-hydrolase [Candidatus Eisenbacteria bacterium]|nr:M20/M25/M40 family metallo-hydrolase [Candidatus Eisenbacteria bacterium]
MRRKLERFASCGTVVSIVALLGCLTGSTPAWDGSEGTVWALEADGSLPSELAHLRGQGWFLAATQDLALFLFPPQLSPGEIIAGSWLSAGPARRDGIYFFYLVEDSQTARFMEPARPLLRRGHTVLLWSPGEVPELTQASRAALKGLRQPVRIALQPHPWPEAAPRLKTRTEFHPLVDVIVQQVEQAEYEAVWQSLDDFETRYTFTSQNELAAQWMRDTFASYGLQAELWEYEQDGPKHNVIGTLAGSVEPERVVYLTGHFDSTSEDALNHAPGADDNASGTAAFLEAARVLSQYDFHHTIKLVGFNGEEQGLVGSRAYVEQIAQAGEDVIACYNFDMIAYRGEDPAPPDLVIYTDEASQPFAQILSDAAGQYLADELEPVVYEELLTASDHASFWSHGYPAILGIEAEVWGDDFSPWYHTSEDRIENYPRDYPTHVTAAAVAAVAQTAVPLVPDAPFLVLDGILVDDDEDGLSAGNGNGVIDYGETIELYVTLKNVGPQDANGVEGVLQTDDDYTVIIDGQASFGMVPGGGGTAVNATPFVFAVGADVPDDHEIVFALGINEEPGELLVELEAFAPVIGVSGYYVDDAQGGDGDGIADAGEDLFLIVRAVNSGGAVVDGLTGFLLSDDPYLVVDGAPREFGRVESGAESQGVAFPVSIDPSAPSNHTAVIEAVFEGAASYSTADAFPLRIGSVFAEDVETGEGAWSHFSGSTGYTDQWHVETYRNHTPGGEAAWKCGGPGPDHYDNGLHGVLESPPFNVSFAGVLTMWHWMSAEILNGTQAWDGGNVEVSADGGESWELLAPEGGYPYVSVDNPASPFPGGTPVFSGQHGWRQETFDLAEHSGIIQIRFVFGSDGAVHEEGWYVDDIEVALDPSGTGDSRERMVLRLHPAVPNPASGASVLRFDLPQRRPVRLGIYDVTGRLVRQLYSGSLDGGRHELRWNGRDGEGRFMGSGVYWARMQIDGETRTTRIVRVE